MAGRIEPVRRVYVDTPALIAFLDKSDSYHLLYRRLFSDPPALSTSALVIAEGHGWFLRRYDTRRSIEFLNFIWDLPRLAIDSFGRAQAGKTLPLLAKFADQELTLADAHGLVIMRDRNIGVCWSTDRHLGLMGATLVR